MIDVNELARGDVRHDLSTEDIHEIYELPITKLIYLAQSVRHKFFPGDEIQLSTLLSIKTGGCKENCAYCPQSAHYDTGINTHGLLDIETIKQAAMLAKENGSSRFCMGAAWRSSPKKGKQFDQVLEAVKEVRKLGLRYAPLLGC